MNAEPVTILLAFRLFLKYVVALFAANVIWYSFQEDPCAVGEDDTLAMPVDVVRDDAVLIDVIRSVLRIMPPPVVVTVAVWAAPVLSVQSSVIVVPDTADVEMNRLITC